jgi:XTP/dITP diphosphohydrolase
LLKTADADSLTSPAQGGTLSEMSASATANRLVIASRNRKKSDEIRDLLALYRIEVVGVLEFADLPDVVEDGATFAENAAKKASETARRLSLWTLGEDSGLEVDALAGVPGIYSARFSGPGATDESNNAKLMSELSAVPDERRGARYVCNVALADGSGKIRLQVEAYCHGRILREARGTNGFGYDPYFLIREYHRTFGELSPAVKRHLSHRARAFERLIPQLVRLIAGPSGPYT